MKMRHTVALAVLTLCAAVQLVAAQNVAAAKLQELVVAYAAAEPNSDLTVVLRNNLADSTIVIQPILRDGNGNETQGKPLTLRSREVRHVPLPALFGGLSDDSGQLLLRFASADADNVAASIVFRRGRREVQPQAAGVDSAKLDKKSESHVVWYLPKPTAHVGLVFTNTGGDAAFAVIDGGAPITVSPKANHWRQWIHSHRCASEDASYDRCNRRGDCL